MNTPIFSRLFTIYERITLDLKLFYSISTSYSRVVVWRGRLYRIGVVFLIGDNAFPIEDLDVEALL